MIKIIFILYLVSTVQGTTAQKIPAQKGTWTVTRARGGHSKKAVFCGFEKDTFELYTKPCDYCKKENKGDCWYLFNQQAVVVGGQWYCTKETDAKGISITSEFDSQKTCGTETDYHCAWIDGLTRIPGQAPKALSAEDAVSDPERSEDAVGPGEPFGDIMELETEEAFNKWKPYIAEIVKLEANKGGTWDFSKWKAYWKGCKTIWHSNYNSVEYAWDDAAISEHVCKVALGPDNKNDTIKNARIMTFSMGNLVFSAAQLAKTCTLSDENTRWISLAGPWSGSGRAKSSWYACKVPGENFISTNAFKVPCGESLYSLSPYSKQFMEKGDEIRDIARNKLYAAGCARLNKWVWDDDCVEVTSCSSGWPTGFHDVDSDYEQYVEDDRFVFYNTQHEGFMFPSPYSDDVTAWVHRHAFDEDPPSETIKQCKFLEGKMFKDLGSREGVTNPYICAKKCMENKDCKGLSFWDNGGCHFPSSGELVAAPRGVVGSWDCSARSAESSQEKVASSIETNGISKLLFVPPTLAILVFTIRNMLKKPVYEPLLPNV